MPEAVPETAPETVKQPVASTDKAIKTDNVTPVQIAGDGYYRFKGGLWSEPSLKGLHPELFSVRADTQGRAASTNFGTQFPKIAAKGDLFVRVDVLPNRVYKFDGQANWIEQNKSLSQSYLYNDEYIEFLIERINSGEYDWDVLSEDEKTEIENRLRGDQKN